MGGDPGPQTGKANTPRSQRRQNTSCDHCRRSKRRCVLPTSQDGQAGVICTNCQRLGHRCTFDFAKSKATSKPKRSERRNSSALTTAASDPSPNNIGFDNVFDIALDTTPFGIGYAPGQDAWAPSLDFDLDNLLENGSIALPCFPGDPGPVSFVAPGRVATTSQAEGDHQSSELARDPRRMQSPLMRGTASVVGASPSSPVYLLNAKVNSRMLDDHLAQIYETIVTGSASRYMDQKCNLYAAERPYKLEYEDALPDSIQSIPTSNSIPSHASNTSLTSLESESPETGIKMTVLGTVRFLDHFGDLYGNRMGPAARRQSDAVLNAAIKAFTLQWLPSSPPQSVQSTTSTADLKSKLASQDAMQNAFIDAWYHVRSLLKDAQSIISFKVIYATFMFDGIALPEKVCNERTDLADTHEFLDAALEKLTYLDGLVRRYVEVLGPQSTYGLLVEASLNIIRWGAYVRDTGASLTSYRDRKLPDLSSGLKGSPVPDRKSHLDLDGSIPGTCRAAFAGAFSVWRQIINIRHMKSIEGSYGLSAEIIQDIQLTATKVQEFNGWFRPFMAHCLESFPNLSMSSRLFSVSFAMVWDLGVFVFIETLKPLMDDVEQSNHHSLLSDVRGYQVEAISSVVQTVQHVLTLSAQETVNLQNGLSADTPIFGYHITPGLMIATLQKAIEQVIELQFSSSISENKERYPVPDGTWDRQIDWLMKGLLSLDVTIGGSQTVRAVMGSLMGKYGDVLSECWLCGFES